jgi:hypothetical protein
MRLDQVLALPRATAFDQGLLVPVARWRRERHHIPLPLRFTTQAWEQLVAFRGPRGGQPTTPQLDVRLQRVLTALHTALFQHGTYTAYHERLHVLMPSWLRHSQTPADPAVDVLISNDDEGTPTLTVLLPNELPG